MIISARGYINVLCRSVKINADTFPKIRNTAHQKRMFATKYVEKGRNMIKLGLAGVAVGTIVGTGYSIHVKNKPRSHIMNEQTIIPLVDYVPKIKPSREVRYANDTSNLKLTLFQYQTCPFCCKVRSFLDYYGISYNVIEVDPVLKQSLKWSSYRKVPILVVETPNGKFQPLNDSTMIISAMASYLKDNKKEIVDIVKCYPFIQYVDESGTNRSEVMNRYFLMISDESKQIQSREEITEERKWRKWADDVLVHSLSPNVYRTREEAFQAFNWFSEVGEWDKNFPEWERQLIIYVGAYAMWMLGKSLKKKYQLKDDVRQSLYDQCNVWLRNIARKGGKFMGGDKPNLADLAVFGVLSSIEGCLAFQDLSKNTNIGKWFNSVKAEIMSHKTLAVR